MEKERFLELALNYTSLTEAETIDLDALQKQYPYSQVIHNLASRGAQDNGLETYKRFLNISAVYSSDRSVLKDIITSPRTQRNGTASPVEIIQHIGHIEHIDNDLHGDALAEEVLIDLERLQQLKHDFEISVEAYEHSSHKTAPKSPPVKKKFPR